MFDVADENKDEVLEIHEMAQFSNYVIEGCQGLSLAQGGEDLKELFARFDTNKDGKIDWEEIWMELEPFQAKLKPEDPNKAKIRKMESALKYIDKPV
jgi:Ca2+-binding EF-hand superfamily protein